MLNALLDSKRIFFFSNFFLPAKLFSSVVAKSLHFLLLSLTYSKKEKNLNQSGMKALLKNFLILDELKVEKIAA
jgi:hypothetical protein